MKLEAKVEAEAKMKPVLEAEVNAKLQVQVKLMAGVKIKRALRSFLSNLSLRAAQKTDLPKPVSERTGKLSRSL